MKKITERGQWGLRYTVCNKNSELVTRTKWFETETRRANWVENRLRMGEIVSIVAYCDDGEF